MTRTIRRQNASKDRNIPEAKQGILMFGGYAALLLVVVALVEIIITFFPDGGGKVESVSAWFALFERNPFMGLRNMGLLNIMMTLLGVPLFLALYFALHRRNKGFTSLALILSVLGVSVFLATNRALPMLELSRHYVAADSEAARAVLLAAGQALLAVGESHTPGTYLAFLLSGLASLFISLVMLKGDVFPRIAAYMGVASSSLLLLFDTIVSFMPSLFSPFMLLAALGGILSMVWYVLVARRLFQLSREGVS